MSTILPKEALESIPDDLPYSKLCLALAKQAAEIGEVPVGAIVVDNQTQKIIAKAYNLRERLHSPLAHAETLAIHRACKILKSWRLPHHTLYTSLEPCTMCSGVIIQARVAKVVISAWDSKGGGQSLFKMLSSNQLNHSPILQQGHFSQESSAVLKAFFKTRRSPKTKLSPKK